MFRTNSRDDLYGIFNNLESLFNRTFSDVFSGSDAGFRALPGSSEPGSTSETRAPLARFGSGYHGVPAVESFEKDGNIHLRMELPGVEPSDVNVNVTGDRLTISGTRKESSETKDASFHIREVSHGSFQRQFTLPKGVETGKVKAEFRNGMLELTVPLPAEQKPKSIKIDVKEGGKKGFLKSA